MPSYFTIVQYVPDPIMDERINIGVIVVSNGTARCHFLQNWRRVAQFGAENVGFLRDFAKEVIRACSPQLAFQQVSTAVRVDEDSLRNMAANYCNSIQLMPLKGSLLDIDTVLSNSIERYLREPQRLRVQLQTRSAIVRTTVRAIESVLMDTVGNRAKDLIHVHEEIVGKYQSHMYDISVVNGCVYFAAQALSFQRQDSDDLQRDVRLIAWDIKDVKEKSPDLPIGVFLLPPASSTITYRNAVSMFTDLTAEVVNEHEVRAWAADKTRRIAA